MLGPVLEEALRKRRTKNSGRFHWAPVRECEEDILSSPAPPPAAAAADEAMRRVRRGGRERRNE